MTTQPESPWDLRGETVVVWCRWKGAKLALPDPLRPVSSRVLIAATRAARSPVGSYVELSVMRPARLGLRVGLCVTTAVVDSPAARAAGRVSWGMPRELGSLVWDDDGEKISVRWVDRGIEVLAVRAKQRRRPSFSPARFLQRRADGLVTINLSMRGWAQRLDVDVDAPADDALAALAGPWRGTLVSDAHTILRPARRPVGAFFSLLAPLPHPEGPALPVTMGDRPRSGRGAVALSSSSRTGAISSAG